MNVYIGIYFNPCGYESRLRLTRDFIKRYPWICLIEVAYGSDPFVINHSNTLQLRKSFKGFIKEELINDYLSQIDIEHVDSVCIIDTDLILPNNFTNLVSQKVKETIDKPTFIQGFGRCSDIRHSNVVPESSDSSIKYYDNFGKFGGHTGYIHIYNQKALRIIKILPEYMYLGAFDTVLFMCLLKQHHLLMKFIDHSVYRCVFGEFYERIKDIEYDYIDCHVFHCFHGLKSQRYFNRPEKYRYIQENATPENFESLVYKYMLSRNEDIVI